MYVGAKQGLIIYYDRSHLPKKTAGNGSLPRPMVAPLTVSIYFFREEEAFEATFVFDENLVEEDTPRFKLNAMHGTLQNFYARASGGVYLSDVSYRGISSSIEDMKRCGTLDTFFNRPAPLPKPRWSNLTLHEVPIPDAAEAYRVKLEEFHGRGTVFLRRYKATSYAEFEACRRVQDNTIWTTFQTELLRHPIFRSLPVFEEPDFNRVADGEWFMSSGLHIEAFLASDLCRGGPYRGADIQTALHLAKAARESLFGENYSDLRLYYLNQRPTGVGQWSKWFWDLIWDRTMIVVEASEKRDIAEITCLFATSTS